MSKVGYLLYSWYAMNASDTKRFDALKKKKIKRRWKYNHERYE